MKMPVIPQNLQQLAIDFSAHLIKGLIVFIIFLLVGYLVSRVILKLTKRAPVRNRPLFVLLAKITNVIFIILGAITALGNVGVNVTALIASLGLTSFGLGFALKDALSNVLSGVLVLVYRPFEINDRVKIGDAVGLVANIDLRYVTLLCDDRKILIPNASLFNNSIAVLADKEGDSS